MIYPTDESMTSYLVIDPDQPVVCREIFIPYYPQVDEVVHVKSGHLNSPDFLIVKHVHHDAHIFEGHKLQLVRGSCRYSVLSRTTRVKISNVLCSVRYQMLVVYTLTRSNDIIIKINYIILEILFCWHCHMIFCMHAPPLLMHAAAPCMGIARIAIHASML